MSNPWVDASDAILRGEAPPLHIAVALSDPKIAEKAWKQMGRHQLRWVVGSVPRLALTVADHLVEAIAKRPDEFTTWAVYGAKLVHDAIAGNPDVPERALFLSLLACAPVREWHLFQVVIVLLDNPGPTQFDIMISESRGGVLCNDALARLSNEIVTEAAVRSLRPLPTVDELVHIAEHYRSRPVR
jgi:hypothetical protein